MMPIVDDKTRFQLRELSLKRYGVLFSIDEIDKELVKMTRTYNYGRARGVSLRRPSPRLSRGAALRCRTMAVLRIAKRKNGRA